MTKRALLVIDLQNDYFPGGKWTLSSIDAAADNAARIIRAARAAGDLLVHVRHESHAEGAPFFVPGTQGAEIHEKVLPAPGEDVVVKRHINSFRETNLQTILDRNGIEEVVIVGAMSHMCVDAATRAARDLGYRVTVIHDACASRDLAFDGTVVPAAQVHAAFMSALGFAYADMVATERWLDTATRAS